MNKNLLLFIPLAFCWSAAVAQQDILVFKEKEKPVRYFKKYSYITAQLKSKQWVTGYIEKVTGDTFYLNPIYVRYTLMGPDTIHYPIMIIPVTDVFAMPRKGEQTSFVNGRVDVTFGHEHWVWLKNGLILRLGAGGYILLNLANGITKKTKVFSAGKIGIAAGIFLIGELLHQTYKPTLRMGKSIVFLR